MNPTKDDPSDAMDCDDSRARMINLAEVASTLRVSRRIGVFSISDEVGWTPRDIFSAPSDSRCDHLDNSEVEDLFRARVVLVRGNDDIAQAWTTIREECVNRHIDIMHALGVTSDETYRARLLNIMHANWYYAEILTQWIVSSMEQCAQIVSANIIELRDVVDTMYESYAQLITGRAQSSCSECDLSEVDQLQRSCNIFDVDDVIRGVRDLSM